MKRRVTLVVGQIRVHAFERERQLQHRRRAVASHVAYGRLQIANKHLRRRSVVKMCLTESTIGYVSSNFELFDSSSLRDRAKLSFSLSLSVPLPPPDRDTKKARDPRRHVDDSIEDSVKRSDARSRGEYRYRSFSFIHFPADFELTRVSFPLEEARRSLLRQVAVFFQGTRNNNLIADSSFNAIHSSSAERATDVRVSASILKTR